MATTASSSSASKSRSDSQNLLRSKSMSTHREKKPKQPDQHTTELSSVSEKAIPNYLKPTISSRPDPEKFIRKHHEDHLHSQNKQLLRRRSFDRPPASISSTSSSASARVQKSPHISPGRPRERPLVPREKNLRLSSSFHGSRSTTTSTNAAKPSHHKSASVPKSQGLSKGTVAKKSSSGGSNLKKEWKKVREHSGGESGNEETKENSSSSSMVVHEDRESEEVEERPKVETESVEEAVSDAEALPLEDKQVQVTEEVEKSETDDIHQQEKKNNGDPELTDRAKVVPSPVVQNDNVVTEAEDQTENEQKEVDEKKEEKTEKIDRKEKDEDKDNNDVIEQKDAKIDSTEAAQDHKEDEEQREENVTNTVTDTEETMKESDGLASNEEKENVVEEGSSEGQIKEESMLATSEAEGSKRQVVQGKKESPAAYNDVIEETASKLLEKRKNKVRALVGAFETVIDYESGSK